MNNPRNRSHRGRALVALATLGLGGCSDPSPAGPVAQTVQPVVYGTDDRQDVYAHPDMNLRTLAQQSIVALMRDTAIDVSDPMAVRYTGTTTLREAQDLCPGQRFENDPTHAHCSGTAKRQSSRGPGAELGARPGVNPEATFRKARIRGPRAFHATATSPALAGLLTG